MPRNRVDDVIASWSHNCAAEVTVAVLGGAWKPVVLSLLGRHEVLRFGELRRAAGEPTPRVLTRRVSSKRTASSRGLSMLRCRRGSSTA